MSKTISVVFSFRNEEKNIAELVRRNVDALAKEPEDYELIFVDDASTDGSAAELRRQREKNPRVKVVTMSRRFGVYESLMAGLSYAQGDAVIYMDSDLQDPPELIPKLLEQWRGGADVVHTVRTKRHGETRFRLWVTLLAYRALSVFSDIPLLVESGDYKLFSKRALSRLLSLKESDPYFRGLAAWVGFTQTVVEYERLPRAAGTSQRGVISSASLHMFTTALTSFTFLPLYGILGVGAAGAAAVVLLAAGGLAAACLGTCPGGGYWTFLLLAFFWSTLMTALGILGVYLMRVYKDVRGRPLYVVRDTVGLDR